VLILEVRLQGVDALEPDTVGTHVPAIRSDPGEPGQRRHEVVVIGQKVDRVAVGLRTVARQIRVKDVKLAADHV
jgi:hypothetical protein